MASNVPKTMKNPDTKVDQNRFSFPVVARTAGVVEFGVEVGMINPSKAPASAGKDLV
jgi:hypothetical protein